MIPIRCTVLTAIILSFTLFGEPSGLGISQSNAGDWPQILGPNRDSQALDEQPLKTDWKADQPQVLWAQPIGSGYAGPAIAQGVVYLADRAGSEERLQALDLTTGKAKWQATWPGTYRSSMDPDSGPRAVPVIANGKAVCYGAAGDLVCIELANGKVLWNLPLRKQFNAEDGYFGAGCSPIVVAGTVIVNIGGSKAGIVGVALDSGKVTWQATRYDASYASPVATSVKGQPAVIVVTRLKTVLLDAASGNVLSEIDFGARGPTVNAATPLRLSDNTYFLTASYSIGAKLVELSGDKLNIKAANKVLLASQYNSPVKVDSVVLGADGREDGGSVNLRVLDVEGLKVLEERPLPGTTHFIAIGPQVLMLSVDGTLQLAQVADGTVTIQSKRPLADKSGGVFRALPAFSNHVLVVRSSQDGRGGEVTAIKLP